MNKNFNNKRPNKPFKKNYEKKQEKSEEEKTYSDIVEGRNSVLELLASDRDINKILIQNGEKHG